MMDKISICIEVPEGIYQDLRTLTLANGGDWDAVTARVLQAGLHKYRQVCNPPALSDHQQLLLRKAEIESGRASQEQLRELYLGAMRCNFLFLNQIKSQMRMVLGLEVEHG